MAAMHAATTTGAAATMDAAITAGPATVAAMCAAQCIAATAAGGSRRVDKEKARLASPARPDLSRRMKRC